MSQTFSPRQYEDVISQLQSIITNLCKEKNTLQAKIDSLMLEFCPEEMTQEQIENWEQHQVVSHDSTNLACSHGREQKKTTPEFKQKMAEGFMFGANFMFACPECGNKRCPKTRNPVFKCTNSNKVDQVGEVDSILFNYDKLVITTGDDVSDVVWTKEKLEELQRVIDKIKREEQSNKQCCEGGPQWGHAWDCPKCPD